MRYALIIVLGLLIIGCDTSRVAEENVDFEARTWNVDSIVSLNFSIEDIESPYTLSMNLRNTSDYPWQRIFVGYWLKDSLGNTLLTNTSELRKLESFPLFDPKTGVPLGKGLGDIFEHRFVLTDSLQFKEEGKYIIEFQQYMRDEDLKGVVSVGYRIERPSE